MDSDTRKDTRNTLAVGTFAIVLFVSLFSLFSLCHACRTNDPKYAPIERATARGVALTVAEAVAISDRTCADLAHQAVGSGDRARLEDAAKLAHACAAAYNDARAGLVAVQAAVDAWDDQAAGRLGCGAWRAAKGLRQVEVALSQQGARVPATVEDAITLAERASSPATCGDAS